MTTDPVRDMLDERLSALLADVGAPGGSAGHVSAAVRARIRRRRRLNLAAGGTLGVILLSGVAGLWSQRDEGPRGVVSPSPAPSPVERMLAADRHVTPPVAHHEFISIELAAIIEALETPADPP